MVFFVLHFIDRTYLPKVITETSLVCTILDIYVFLTNGLYVASVMSGVVYIQSFFMNSIVLLTLLQMSICSFHFRFDLIVQPIFLADVTGCWMCPCRVFYVFVEFRMTNHSWRYVGAYIEYCMYLRSCHDMFHDSAENTCQRYWLIINFLTFPFLDYWTNICCFLCVW